MLDLGRLYQPVARVLTNRLEQAIPMLTAARLVDAHQRLVDEPAEKIEDVVLVDAVARADRLRSRECPSSSEDGQPPQHSLLRLRQKVVAPPDGRFQRALAGDGGSTARGQQTEPILEPGIDLIDAQDRDACCGRSIASGMPSRR